MAERRMIARNILFSNNLQALSVESRYLYVLLISEADDDGFVSSSNLLVQMATGTEENLKALEEKGFIFYFPSGVVLARHWFQHNQIRKDRHHESVLAERRLVTTTADKVYVLKQKQPEPCNPEDEVPQPSMQPSMQPFAQPCGTRQKIVRNQFGNQKTWDFEDDDDVEPRPDWLDDERP